ncbi:MAG: TetR/AcrR family transcriptional regulator [Acidobacteria bacterium]|nr:TetR/AcrR family transcriptional regulator [Acidobacteriota bacterium]
MNRTAETRRGPAQGSGAAAAAGGRMAGEDRRQQILGVAMGLFSRHGFRGTTTKEIASAAGVSEAMVFRHFATKQELYSAILDHKACAGGLGDPCEIFGDAIRRKDDRGVFTALGLALMRQHEEDPEFLRLLTHAALEEHELASMFWERTIRQMYDFLGGYVRDRQREGAMRAVDPAVVVRAFLGMIIHHSLNNTLWDKKRSLINLTNERAAAEFTEILLRGVSAGAQARAGAKAGRKMPPARRKKQTGGDRA